MRLEMITKVWVEAAWNDCISVGFGSDTVSASLQESMKMLQAWTSCYGEDLVAMESPGQAVERMSSIIG
jgi:hypothetical protein